MHTHVFVCHSSMCVLLINVCATHLCVCVFQVMPVVVTGFGVANFPSTEDSEGMALTFSALHCGGVRGEASGNLMVRFCTLCSN